MLQLFFCDDNKIQLELYTELARKCIFLQDWDVEMGFSAHSSEELLAHLPTEQNTGLYFLDIELSETENGFQLADKIRQKDPRAFLVFITSHMEQMAYTFKFHLEAMDFIGKSLDHQTIKERIDSCIRTAYERYLLFSGQSSEFLCLKKGSSVQILPCSHIRYLSNSQIPHHITIHTEDGILDYAGSLKEIAENYSGTFLQCSRTLLVNKHHIRSLDSLKRGLILKDGTVLPCSLRALASIKKTFTT